jgi:hypothetical protein
MDKRVQSITVKNIPLDPEKCIMAQNDGDPVDTCSRECRRDGCQKTLMQLKTSNEYLAKFCYAYSQKNAIIWMLRKPVIAGYWCRLYFR